MPANECNPRFLSERSERTHLGYYDDIRPAIFSVDFCKCPFRDRHTIVFYLLREHSSHPGTWVIRFKCPNGGRIGPVRVGEEGPGE